MNSRSLGADAVLAWPNAELAVMGAEGAADVIFRKQIDAEPDRRDELVEQYRADAMHVDLAARRGSVDEIIAPERDPPRPGRAAAVAGHRPDPRLRPRQPAAVSRPR